MQRMIDAGALTTWTEENGLEMCAEFTREVGGGQRQKNNLRAERELFFCYHCVYVSFCACPDSEHLCVCMLEAYVFVSTCVYGCFLLNGCEHSYDEARSFMKATNPEPRAGVDGSIRCPQRPPQDRHVQIQT